METLLLPPISTNLVTPHADIIINDFVHYRTRGGRKDF